MRAAALALCVLALDGAAGRKSRGAGRGKVPAEPESKLGCSKCKSAVMRMLVPMPRGCAGTNGTLVKSSTPTRAQSAYCDALLPKKRQCLVYSFGVDSVWDFDRALLNRKDPAGAAAAG